MRITHFAAYAFTAWFALGPWLYIYRDRDELRRTDRMDKAKLEAYRWTLGVVVIVGIVFWAASATGPDNRCPEGSYWDSDGGGYGMSGAIGACV